MKDAQSTTILLGLLVLLGMALYAPWVSTFTAKFVGHGFLWDPPKGGTVVDCPRLLCQVLALAAVVGIIVLVAGLPPEAPEPDQGDRAAVFEDD